MKIDEGNIFLIGGIVEEPESYNAAIALYDYLWALKPELREKLIKSWILLLSEILQEDILAKASPEYADGTAVVFVSEEPIEIRNIPDNVVPFRSKDGRQRIETKKIEG